MKTYTGSGGIAPLTLTLGTGGRCEQLYLWLLYLGNEFGYRLNRRLGGPQGRLLDGFGEEINLMSLLALKGAKALSLSLSLSLLFSALFI